MGLKADRGPVVHHGDCADVLKTLPTSSVDSVVTDPPYGLGFMEMSWDAAGDKGSGYHYKDWIGPIMGECLRVLKPGGHLIAFGGTRTVHWLVTVAEDAGFQIRDQLAWMYATGFPKSRRQPGRWRGWGTALKPAWEPMVLARKPLGATSVAANLSRYRTGGLHIDAARVGTERAVREAPGRRETVVGRHPTNVMHDGSDEVMEVLPERVRRVFFCAKPSQKDKEAGCEALPQHVFGMSGGAQRGGLEYDAGQSIGFNRSSLRRNHHPTVKPIALMQHLCRLVTAPGGVVLDPFCGSGSTGRAAVLEGFGFIGIESEASYVEIARARIRDAVEGVEGVVVTGEKKQGVVTH